MVVDVLKFNESENPNLNLCEEKIKQFQANMDSKKLFNQCRKNCKKQRRFFNK